MILAATGHRPPKLGGYAPHIERSTRAYAMACLYETRPDKVISGMALGWDTAVADAAVTMGIPLIAAIPFYGQESRWPREAQGRYDGLLKAASKIVVIADACEDELIDISVAMQKRNEWMVNHCDLLLALWDGSDGGTANCVRYARRAKCPTLHVWDAFWMNNIPF